MIKIVYFDEFSATDYLTIYDGGEVVKTSEEIKAKSKELAGKASAKLFAKYNWLPFIGGEAMTSGNMDLSNKGSLLIKTTLDNTVLTDFLEKSKNDNRIVKLNGYNVYAYKNSIAYFKMFTPYLKMTSNQTAVNEGLSIDISKMDEAIESGKGYYEMIAEKNDRNDKHKMILRFNIEAFRNNYGIADLVKMNLCYFAIRVGSAAEYTLDIEKEFSFEQEDIVSAFDLEQEVNANDDLEVYDVVLAGIGYE